MTITNVTFIGLGVMGFPMAGHLKNNNYNVTVFNRTTSKSDSWIKEYKGQAQLTAGKASQNSEIVFTCVGNDNDLKEYLSKISDEALFAYNVYQIEGEGKKLFSTLFFEETNFPLAAKPPSPSSISPTDKFFLATDMTSALKDLV